ncbi:hypothetical protein Prudu_1389S000200 [Prunus dulcis]|uniref:Uncharacterized protein n=1 Tax=Prunus dulcis TaxID=3755 RepID=A0A5H2XUA2_PRUDU|nr:hypothetical protein Prudu_1389S000200 [Prunus dulcis]
MWRKESEKKKLALRRNRKLSAFFTLPWKSHQAQQIRAGSFTIKSQTPNKLRATRLIKIKSLRPLYQTQISLNTLEIESEDSIQRL